MDIVRLFGVLKGGQALMWRVSDASARRSRSAGILARFGFVIGLLLSVTGCLGSTASPSASATRTANAANTQTAQATRIAMPVRVDISVQQQGTTLEHNSQLQIAVAITNQTTASIHVIVKCGYAPVLAHLAPKDGKGPIWTQDTYSCPPKPAYDDTPEILPGVSYTYRYLADLKGLDFHTGSYLVTATFQWHQGTLEQAGVTPGVLYGQATGEATIMVV